MGSLGKAMGGEMTLSSWVFQFAMTMEEGLVFPTLSMERWATGEDNGSPVTLCTGGKAQQENTH